MRIDNWIKSFHKVSLGILPTPIHKLKNIEKELNYKNIYIKRDDLNGVGAGGNKIRSLEFILGDAIKKEKNLIIVSGPLQSNLCSLTAASCAKLGLKCVIVVNGETNGIYEGNMLLNHILGVEIHEIGNVGQNQREEYVNSIFNEYKENGYDPYIIENGATTGIGALGYVSAIIEIKEQCDKYNLDIKEIFAPGGNGGVATGLIYGNALIGSPFKINIISVEDDVNCLKQHILSTIEEIVKITSIPFDYKLEDVCFIDDSYRGEGWGINTKESEEEVYNFAKSEGIFIENVYNSKVLVAMKHAIKNKNIDNGVCYLHTGGFGSLFSQIK